MSSLISDKPKTVHEMALDGEMQAVVGEIRQKPELVNKVDDSGRLPLHWACSKGHLELVKWLLDQSKTPNAKDDSDWTPLIISASAGHTDIVKVLLEHGADVHAVTNQGRGALLYAASKNRLEIVNTLLAQGADINKQDVLGQTPLHRSAGPGHDEVVKLIINSQDSIVDVQDRYGNTALHYACEEERLITAKLLITAGANLEIENKEEKTPLMKCTPGFARSLKK